MVDENDKSNLLKTDPENGRTDGEDGPNIHFTSESPYKKQNKSHSVHMISHSDIPLFGISKHNKSLRFGTSSAISENEDMEVPLPRFWTMDHHRDMSRIKFLRKIDHRTKKLNTQLLVAIERGDLDDIDNLLTNSANPNSTCRQSLISACHLAALVDNDSLSLLIKREANCLRPDKQGRTPLHYAAWEGNKNQIALLLDLPYDLRQIIADDVRKAENEIKRSVTRERRRMINTACFTMETPFPPKAWLDSIEHNCDEITAKLPHIPPDWTALHAASARVQADCVRLLLAAGADPCAQDFFGRTPLDVVGSAHYQGHSIDATRFRESICILLAAGSKLYNAYLSNLCDRSSLLHTAVELESLEAVEELLASGASPTSLNNKNLTPMHVCVEKRHGEHLKLLANHEQPNISIVDAKDGNGYTVLHYAIKLGWKQGMCIALAAGADATIKAENGDYPLHTAATLGDINIFQEILTEIITTKGEDAVNVLNSKSETVLMIAIMEGHIDLVQLLLEKNININASMPNKCNALHIAAKTGCADILELLLSHSCFNEKEIINASTKSECFTPLLFAVENNNPDCVERLIAEGASVNMSGIFYDDVLKHEIKSYALHRAASKGYVDIAQLIIHDKRTIQLYDSEGRQPLHEACRNGNRDMITLLLHNGADLSQETRHSKVNTTAFQMLMENISHPTAYLEEIFDTYISTQGKSLQETDCNVTVNYSILVPNPREPKQLEVIKALLKTGNRYGQRNLLLHPLVQSFLCLKWKSLLIVFNILLALYAFYVIILNLYVVSNFMYFDVYKRTGINDTVNASVATIVISTPKYFKYLKYLVYIATSLILVQEIVFTIIWTFRNFLNLESWIKSSAIICSFILPSMLPVKCELRNDDKNSKCISDSVRFVAGLTLLLSWTEIMCLLSRFPNWGFYVLMFGKVASKVVKILFTFCFLIFGFSLCFMIQFYSQAPFEDPLAALVKTFVMMSSEYDYVSTIADTPNKPTTYIGTLILRGTFMIFLIIISIVLMNLMVGVAVNDVNNLERIGNIKRLEKQVEFLTSLEDIVCYKIMLNIIPPRVIRRLSKRQKLKENVVVLRPRQATCKYSKRIPKYIREAIFENVQFQNMQRDEELGSISFKQKIEEIHEAIVRNEAAFDSVTLVNAIQNLNAELTNLKNDMAVLKQFASTKMRRTSI